MPEGPCLSAEVLHQRGYASTLRGQVATASRLPRSVASYLLLILLWYTLWESLGQAAGVWLWGPGDKAATPTSAVQKPATTKEEEDYGILLRIVAVRFDHRRVFLFSRLQFSVLIVVCFNP